MEDVEVMEDVEDETELLMLIVDKLISINSKSFQKYTGDYRNTSDLKNVLERIP